MIRKVATSLLAGLAIVVAVPGVASAATPEDVDGFWTSVDAVDGSNQILVITELPGGGFGSVLFDDDATVACGGGPALATGSGTLSGDTLTVTYQIRCFNGTDAPAASIDYEFDSGAGTLNESSGTVWTNVFG